MVRVLHTGDVHLGRAFKGFGKFGRTLRAQVRQTFLKLLREAPGRFDLVLVAGDLFDGNEPDPSEIRHFLSAVREIPGLPVVVLPGTHDRYSANSVYRQPDFSEAQRPANLRLFVEDGPQSFYFPELGLAVHGRANLVNRGGQPPLKDIRPHPEARFNIAVAHASVPMPTFEADDEHDYYVRPDDAEASGMDYIAMGHWHRFAECFTGLPCCYSGSPERVDFKDESGSFAVVELGGGRARATRESCGRYRWHDIEVDLSGREDDLPLHRRLEELASRDAVVRVRVTGRPAAHYRPRLETVIEEMRPEFAWLEISNETKRQLSPKETEDLIASFPSGSVGDFFCRAVAAKLKEVQGVSSEGEKLWSEVLSRGTALLLGKEDVQA